MTDFREIYAHRAAFYDRLVSQEDHAGCLLPAIEAIVRLDGARVVELGAGTGRVTRLVAPRAASVFAFDGSAHMIGYATALGLPNARFGVADSRALPVRSGVADLAIEGWSVSHMVDWHPATWREEAGKAVAELRRVLAPGGTAIAIETLGTGFTTPTPPSPELAEYYEWLEGLGFTRTWCRTDYRFESVTEAETLARPFFGDALADRIARERITELPECTGIWWWRS